MLIPNYTLGRTFGLLIGVDGNGVVVNVDGEQVSFTAKSSGNSFKAGAYVQSNPSKASSTRWR